MSEFGVGKKIKIINTNYFNLFNNGSTGTILAKDERTSAALGSSFWWVRFDVNTGAETGLGNTDYVKDTGDNDFLGVWTVCENKMEVIGVGFEAWHFEAGRKVKKEWKPDQVREDVDLMQSIRDACGG